MISLLLVVVGMILWIVSIAFSTLFSILGGFFCMLLVLIGLF